MSAGLSALLTMGSASSQSTKKGFLACSGGCTQATIIRAPASGLPFANGLWIDTMDRSGSTPNLDKDRPSASRSRLEVAHNRLGQVQIVEDNIADVPADYSVRARKRRISTS